MWDGNMTFAHFYWEAVEPPTTTPTVQRSLIPFEKRIQRPLGVQ